MQDRQQAEAEVAICEAIDKLPRRISMYGARIHNPNPSQSQRAFYDIHPYTKQGSGVSCTITYTDAKTQIPYILLSKKRNKNQYSQIGGYTRGQGPEGSEINYDNRSEDERDAKEEEMIGNHNAIQVSENKMTTPTSTSTSYSLKQLKEASIKEFIKQQTIKLGKKINPVHMKKALRDDGIVYENDYNAWDTVLRETKEETGLDLQGYKPKELYTSDDFGISNEDERLHTKTTHYLFHLGTLEKAPEAKAGSDLETLKWIPVTEIDLKNGRVKNDLPIYHGYLLQTLPRALKKLRELELARATDHRFIKAKSLGASVFSDPFSLEACEYHKEILDKGIKATQLLKQLLPENKEEESTSRRTLSR